MGLGDDWIPAIKAAVAGIFGEVSDDQVKKLAYTLWGESQPEAKHRRSEPQEGRGRQGAEARTEGVSADGRGSEATRRGRSSSGSVPWRCEARCGSSRP